MASRALAAGVLMCVSAAFARHESLVHILRVDSQPLSSSVVFHCALCDFKAFSDYLAA